MVQADILDRLFDVIEARRRERPDNSYVVSLLDGGVDAVAAKMREECEEVIEAAVSGDVEHLADEVADLLFHTWVMLAAAGGVPSRSYAVLEKRFGTGGLIEKASRKSRADSSGESDRDVE